MTDLDAIRARNEERRRPVCCLQFRGFRHCPTCGLEMMNRGHECGDHPPYTGVGEQELADIEALLSEVERLRGCIGYASNPQTDCPHLECHVSHADRPHHDHSGDGDEVLECLQWMLDDALAGRMAVQHIGGVTQVSFGELLQNWKPEHGGMSDLPAIRARVTEAQYRFLDQIELEIVRGDETSPVSMLAALYPALFEDIDTLLAEVERLRNARP